MINYKEATRLVNNWLVETNQSPKLYAKLADLDLELMIYRVDIYQAQGDTEKKSIYIKTVTIDPYSTEVKE